MVRKRKRGGEKMKRKGGREVERKREIGGRGKGERSKRKKKEGK